MDQLHEIVAAVFAQGPVIVRQAYSDFGCATKEYADPNALLDDLHVVPAGVVFRQYTLYYPEAKGYTHERRIALNPQGPQFPILPRRVGTYPVAVRLPKVPESRVPDRR
jgi:hypothetical protein